MTSTPMTQDIDKLVADLREWVTLGGKPSYPSASTYRRNMVLNAADALTTLAKRLEEAEADIGWVQTAHLICERLGIEPSADALHICGGIATLRAELEAVKAKLDVQLSGHRLSARDATKNLIRATTAEAQLEEMTRSCLAEREGRLAAEAESGRLRVELQKVCDLMPYSTAQGEIALAALTGREG